MAPAPCAQCHAGPTGLRAPGHAACFTACHGGGPARVTVAGRAAVCAVCHADPSVAPRRAQGAGGPATLSATLSHRAHASIACAACHPARPAAPHARCAGCHDGRAGHGAPMARCESCHAPGRATPKVRASALALTFSHPRHAARGGGTTCAACHTTIDAVAGAELPRAPVAACASCHDGRAAFATTAACTQCHGAAPTTAWTSPPPGARFSHAAHGDAAAACATCHGLTATGAPTVAHHAACAGCHSMHPTDAATPHRGDEASICGACHDGAEPWRHLVADRAPPDETELGVSLDHGAHPGACTSCHARRSGGRELAMPHGHAACTGDACHTVAAGALPHLTSCDGCHRVGLAAARRAARQSAPWSVRAAFGHDAHAARGATTCEACHVGLAGAPLLTTPTPAKATCAPCHDGAAAFKLTGTTCGRCHRAAPLGMTPAP